MSVAPRATALRMGRFAVVGAINTAIDLGLFAVLYHGAGLGLLTAHAIAFSVAVINSYLFNKLWTFADRSRGLLALRRGLGFFAVALGGLLVSSAILWVCHFWMPAMLAKLVAVVGSFAWNYWGSSRWIFRPPARGTQ